MNNLPFIMLACGVLGAVLGYYSKPSTKPTLLDYATKLTDQEQLLLLTVFGMAVATATSLSVLLYIFASGIRDAVVIGLATGFITLINGAAWSVSFAYWFQSSNSSRNKDKALAEIASAPEPPK